MSANTVLARSNGPTSPKTAHVKAFFEAGSEPGHLTHQERDELSRCEAVIRKGWDSFVEVGIALTQIREQRLYRENHKTFEAYCREKWDYRKSHAYRLIAAAQVVKCLSPIGDIPKPTHESQVRPLIGLEPDKVREIWKKAAAKAGGAVKARLVKELAQEFKHEEPARTKSRVAPESRKREGSVNAALKWIAKAEEALRGTDGSQPALRLLRKAKETLSSMK